MDHPETAPPVGPYPILRHQTQPLLHMPARFAERTLDIFGSYEALPVPGKYRSGCSQSSIRWNTVPPVEKLEKAPMDLKVLLPYRWNNNMN